MRVYPDLTVDEEFQSLGDSGYTGSMNDRQKQLLGDAGYTGSLSDMFKSFVDNGRLGGNILDEPEFENQGDWTSGAASITFAPGEVLYDGSVAGFVIQNDKVVEGTEYEWEITIKTLEGNSTVTVRDLEGGNVTLSTVGTHTVRDTAGSDQAKVRIAGTGAVSLDSFYMRQVI